MPESWSPSEDDLLTIDNLLGGAGLQAWDPPLAEVVQVILAASPYAECVEALKILSVRPCLDAPLRGMWCNEIPADPPVPTAWCCTCYARFALRTARGEEKKDE
jgi:hypothetical protein